KRTPSNTNSRKLEDDFDSRSKFRQSRFEKKTNQAYQKRLDVNKVEEFQFKRNLTEKEVRINLFVIEGTAGFEALSLREKTTKIASFGDSEFLEWFYEEGIRNSLPDDWITFKENVVEYCINKGIANMFKYKEETWSNYVERLIDYTIKRKIDQNKIISKILCEFAPRKVRTLALTCGENCFIFLEKLKFWEENFIDFRSKFRPNLDKPKT
ncbi:hypothetical protein EDEG_04247, partial [Edhazardia aedis USNM 41457]